MDKKIVGLLGAISSVAAMTAVQAAPSPDATEISTARSYAELLQPIPNAVALLEAARAADAERAKTETGQDQSAQMVWHHHITITIIIAGGITTTTTIIIAGGITTTSPPLLLVAFPLMTARSKT